MKSNLSLLSSSRISSTPIYLAEDSAIHATAIGPIKAPIPLAHIPGLVVHGLTKNLLSIGQWLTTESHPFSGRTKSNSFKHQSN